jgi:hypothetical protein
MVDLGKTGFYMVNGLLQKRIGKCSVGAKFFLIRFVQIYGTGIEVALSVKVLAQEVGVTDRVASDAIQQLVALGLLSQESTGGKPGRPSSSYMCVMETLAVKLKLGVGVGQKSIHSDSINQLLHGVRHRESERLHYANRLLLAVLLVHADEFGAVRELGLRDLSDLTGLKKAVLHQRLVKLQDQCFIRVTVPGVTGRALFKLTKSLYILNLGHPLLQVQAGPYPLVLRNARNTYPARSIFVAARISKNGPLNLGHGSYVLGGLFEAQNSARLVPMLQSTIDGYASFLLSKHFDALAQNLSEFNELLERIRLDFEHLGEKIVGSSSDQNNPGNLTLLLHAEAVTWAKQIMTAIKETPHLCGGTFKYMLLPPSQRFSAEAGCWALLVIPTETSMLREIHVLDWDPSKNGSYKREEDIRLEDRYRYGLLTRPRGSSKVNS